jgi:hypothetical protein
MIRIGDDQREVYESREQPAQAWIGENVSYIGRDNDVVGKPTNSSRSFHPFRQDVW